MKPIPFPFVGSTYVSADPDQDIQELINWYIEKSTNEQSKESRALIGCPGLTSVLSVITGPVRGAWVLPGGGQAIFVAANSVYLLQVTVPASATTKATFGATLVGAINSTTGPVSIRDNATGGIAVIVDGTPNGYVYNIAAKTVSTISTPGFYGADRVAFIDGWLIFNKPGTQIFYLSPLYWNGTDAFDATLFALKDSSTDNLVSLIESLRELWLIGERTTEIWYDAGNQYFAFSRLQGITLQIGTSAAQSVCRFQGGLIWLSKSERGQNIVVATEGYAHQVVSTAAMSKELATYPVVSDAIGYTYSEEGHSFYVLTFPTADVTWVFDAQSGEWHKRASYDPVTGKFHRHRSNCQINFQNQTLVGDYVNGSVYRMDRSSFTDAGNPLVGLRRTLHIWDGIARERVFHSQMQIQFRAGVGLQTGQGSAPSVMLRWSDDSGFTWSNEYQASPGAAGATKTRVIWRRLGASRDRVYEVRVSDPVNRDIVGATLWVDQ